MAVSRLSFNQKAALGGVLLLFFVLFALLPVVNYFNFRSAYDLAMYGQVVSDFANFETNYFTLDVNGQYGHFFSAHFQPIMFLFFFVGFFDQAALILQLILIISFLGGGIAIYKLAKIQGKSESVGLFFMLAYFCQWSLFAAVSAEFHPSVLAVNVFFWALYCLRVNKLKSFLVCIAFMLLCKENVGIYLSFLLFAISLMPFWAIEKKQRNFLYVASIFSLAYSFVVISFVMPHFSDGEYVGQLLRYNHFGDSIGEIVSSLVLNPFDGFSYLFSNVSQNPAHDYIKLEFLIVFIVSGGFLVFRFPQLIVAMIPLIGQKFLSSDPAFWGTSSHYSIEFAPIIIISLFLALQKGMLTPLLSKRFVLPSLVVAIAMGVTIYTMTESRDRGWDKRVASLVDMRHYDSELDLEFINKSLEMIPSGTTVSVSSHFAPKLSGRCKLYHFPHYYKAQYAALFLDKRSTYPLSESEFAEKVQELLDLGAKKISSSDEIVILDLSTVTKTINL